MITGKIAAGALKVLFLSLALSPSAAAAASREPRATFQSTRQGLGTACADRHSEETKKEEMNALIVTLLAWIAAKTGLAAPEPPRIVFVPKHEMAQLYYGDEEPLMTSTQHQIAGKASDSLRPQALYVRANATIYLPQTWRPEGLRNQSILLHELVHHVQRSSGVIPECPAAVERQAYDLQAMWLREQGVADPYDVIGIGQFTVLILSVCMPPGDW